MNKEKIKLKKIMPIKLFLSKWFLRLAVVFLIIILIETFTRAYVLSQYDINNWGFNLGGYGDLIPNKNFIATENPNLPYHVVTNSFGLRNIEETKLIKHADTIRILAVGDSFTLGPYVNNQDTYPAKLEKYLRKEGVKVEVLNAGVSGYTLKDELEYLEEKGLALKPDLIILGVYENDLNDYASIRRDIFSRKVNKEKVRKYGYLLTLAKKSSLLNFIEKIARTKVVQINVENFNREVANNSSELLEEYIQDLDKYLDLITRNNVKTIFLFFPNINQIQQEDNSSFKKILEKVNNKYPVIDLTPIFKQEYNPEGLYLTPLNGHLSVYGNEIVARNVVKIVKQIVNLN